MEWISEINWLWWVSKGWPAFLAAPGLVAFWWQWRDRRDRDELTLPVVRIEDGANFGFAPKADMHPVSFKVRNNLETPIEITELEILNPRGAKVALKNQPSLSNLRSSVTVSWSVDARSEAPTNLSPWILLISSSALAQESADLEIKYTFLSISAKRRQRTIKAIIPTLKLQAPNNRIVK